MTSPRRAIIIAHDVSEMRAALAAAVRTGRAVRVQSAPGAASYLGVAVFAAMCVLARADHPAADAEFVLDCADDPGFAVAAFRHGIGCVRLSASPAVLARVADIARQQGCCLVEGDDPALDLSDAGEPLAACLNWLATSGDAPLPPGGALPRQGRRCI